MLPYRFTKDKTFEIVFNIPLHILTSLGEFLRLLKHTSIRHLQCYMQAKRGLPRRRKNRLDTTQRNMKRSMLGLSLPEHIRSEFKSLAEWRTWSWNTESRSSAELDMTQGSQITGGPVQLSNGIQQRDETTSWRGRPRGVMVKMMDCGFVVSKFKLQLRNYVHFRANTIGKGMNPLILPAKG